MLAAAQRAAVATRHSGPPREWVAPSAHCDRSTATLSGTTKQGAIENEIAHCNQRAVARRATETERMEINDCQPFRRLRRIRRQCLIIIQISTTRLKLIATVSIDAMFRFERHKAISAVFFCFFFCFSSLRPTVTSSPSVPPCLCPLPSLFRVAILFIRRALRTALSIAARCEWTSHSARTGAAQRTQRGRTAAQRSHGQHHGDEWREAYGPRCSGCNDRMARANAAAAVPHPADSGPQRRQWSRRGTRRLLPSRRASFSRVSSRLLRHSSALRHSGSVRRLHLAATPERPLVHGISRTEI